MTDFSFEKPAGSCDAMVSTTGLFPRGLARPALLPPTRGLDAFGR